MKPFQVGEYRKYAGLIRDAAAAAGVPGDLLALVLFQACGFDADVIACKGRHFLSAQGIAKFEPDPARRYGLLSDAGDLRSVPAAAVPAAARYLADLRRQLGGWDAAVVAFHADAGIVEAHRRRGVPLPIDGRRYAAQAQAVL